MWQLERVSGPFSGIMCSSLHANGRHLPGATSCWEYSTQRRGFSDQQLCYHLPVDRRKKHPISAPGCEMFGSRDASSESSTPVESAQTVELLISHGARVNATDAGGSTALHCAVECKAGRQVLELLLSGGADMQAEDNNGHSPLQLAASSGRSAQCCIHPYPLTCLAGHYLGVC